MINKIDINKFPFKTIRPSQKKLIEKLNQHLDKKYIICEIPTGGGKSGIAIDICNSFKSGFVITATKQLQDQYMNDFEDTQNIVSIKGKANYTCALNEKLNCENGYCIADAKQLKHCKMSFCCPYYTKRQEAINSKIFLTSYQYFFRACECAKWIKERDVLIFDECHLLEQQIITWAELKLSFKELIDQYHIETESTDEEFFKLGIIPTESGMTKSNKNWLKIIYSLIFKKRKKLFDEIAKKLNLQSKLDTLSDDDYELIISTHKDYYKLDKMFKKLDIFFRSIDMEKEWLIKPYEDGLQLTPLTVDKLFKEYIDKMGYKKIIFMSGTILDVVGFKKMLGLEDDNTFSIRMESLFDSSKSPIIYKPIGKMGYKYLEESLPKIKQEVIDILNQHPNEKGIIHAGNITISKYLKDNINSTRLLVRYGDIENSSIIKKHIRSNQPTVLVSSSLAEGVDLKNDLSRFQIILKLPWISLTDERVKQKIQNNDDWYAAEMFRKLIQQCGRSTRNENDYSTTYILDESFKFWFKKYQRKGWFTKQFINRVIFK